jgi:predicted nucleotidyltransferase
MTLKLLHDTARELQSRKVPHALIGAGAMAVYGVVRATDDLDLLVIDRATLNAAWWEALQREGTTIDVRPGDPSDPLAGVVRLTTPRSECVDVVVGRSPWMGPLLQRATEKDITGATIPVVTVPDLILLKLYAGAARDLYDVQELLALEQRQTIQAAVDREIARLPRDAREEWHKITHGRGHGRGR